MAHRNATWTQTNPTLDAALTGRISEKLFDKDEEVVWLDLRVVRELAKATIRSWRDGRYPGKREQTVGLHPYDHQTMELFKSPVDRGTVEELLISTYHTAAGDFSLFTTGKLAVSVPGPKYPYTITMYGYYRGADLPMVFRVKPAQQEKWEHLTEQWSKSTHKTFAKGITDVGEVYKIYRRVLDKCAEKQYAKTVD